MWQSEAPSNIALIKYMGKSEGNVPLNPSLSYTLKHFRTRVEITPLAGSQDLWEPLAGQDPRVSKAGQEKFLQHFLRLKTELLIEGNYLVKSGNNFPAACGLASSASSFAALTMATGKLAMAAHPGKDLTARELSEFSRRGSGSSCRSFFGPWCIWDEKGARDLALPYQHLIHQAVILEGKEKAISSTDAHQRVLTSLSYNGRSERALERYTRLIRALQDGIWSEARDISWGEFWDMHALFETSTPPFGYMKSESLEVLRRVSAFIHREGDGPVVTMDAGPNVHLLYRPDQLEVAKEIHSIVLSGFEILGDGCA